MGERPANDLATRARQGDHQAYTQLVHQHRAVAFRVAYLIVGSAAEAEDAVQEAFVKAYLALHRFLPGSEFRPWLLKIVGNEARNRRRSSGRRLHYESRLAREAASSYAAPSPEVAVEAADMQQRLVEAVNTLPPRERLVVGLRYFLELSEEETARAAGIPRGTVKSRLSRAIRRLRVTMMEEATNG